MSPLLCTVFIRLSDRWNGMLGSLLYDYGWDEIRAMEATHYVAFPRYTNDRLVCATKQFTFDGCTCSLLNKAVLDSSINQKSTNVIR